VQRWVRYEAISPNLRKAVLVAEDDAFWTHDGVDVEQLKESIEKNLGSRNYARLRVGIGRERGAREITGHVLGRFSSTEAELMDKILTVASDQAEAWLEAGIQKAMSQFNGAAIAQDSDNERKDQ
jgi:membrane carboxypeptidase/penicillin-binding protein